MGGIAGIEIRHDAVTMIDRMASSHPPTVQVLTPNGGEELAAGATISCPNSSPLPLILQPPDGLVLRANEPVVLEGMATDDEDGPINTGLTWQSSLDGDLGSGQELPVNLTPGKHRLTLTAIDSEGLTGADTVTILIVRASSEMFLPIVLSDY